MENERPLTFRCLLCGDIICSFHFGQMNECSCGNLVMQEDEDGYMVSTNVEGSFESMDRFFDDMDFRGLAAESHEEFEDADENTPHTLYTCLYFNDDI